MKRLLRLMPRRAVLHRYPVIGRFAPQLRRRSYLWSFRRKHVRNALYAGAILALLPLFGIQLPLALIAALFLRANFMILGGLQFITNPFTAAPLYFATHQLGLAVLTLMMGAPAAPEISTEQELVQIGGYVADTIVEPLAPPTATPAPAPSARIRRGLLAMTIGGALVGAVLGATLDLIDALLRRRLQPRRPARRGNRDS